MQGAEEMLFQKTQVQFPTSTWTLTTSRNSRPWKPDAHSGLLQVSVTPVYTDTLEDKTLTCKQDKINQIFKKKTLSLESQYLNHMSRKMGRPQVIK